MTKLTILILLATLGCASGANVRPVANTERTVTTWGGDESFGKRHVCTEYVTPAEKLDARKLAVSVPLGGDKSVSASYEASQNLAAIYTVTEIMQFGHAALYRLCEASGNQVVSNREYKELFSGTLQQVHGLIELELRREQTSTENRLMVLLRDIAQLDADRCALQVDHSAEAIERDKANADKRAKLVSTFASLKSASEVKYLAEPGKSPVPTMSDRAALDNLVTKVKEAHKKADSAEPAKKAAALEELKAATKACQDRFTSLLAGDSKEVCGRTETVCQ
jgi:hypothetical protein